MPTKRNKPNEQPVEIKIDENLLNASFKACYAIVARLISRKPDSVLNITNWKTELFANEYFDAETHNLNLKLTINGVSNEQLFDEKFMPAIGKGDGHAGAYVGDLNNADFDDKLYETYSLFAYLMAWLVCGKQLAIVNEGRALILDKMISELKITHAELTINRLSFGGNPTKTARDYIVSFEDMKNLIKFQTTRAEKLLKLEDKSGHETRPHVERKVKKHAFKPYSL